MPVIPVVSYMSTEFAGCSVGRGISRGAQAGLDTHVNKKKKKYLIKLLKCQKPRSFVGISWLLNLIFS
jgi:hypothetical protein